MFRNIIKKIIILILTLEARLVLFKYRPKIVAVIGSVGKTTTKDAVFAVLQTVSFVRKSEKSFNSDIGVPLSILGLPNGWSDKKIWFSNIIEGIRLIVLKNHYPSWLVLEVGADRPGDISRIASWLKPDVIIVTQFGSVPVHVEFFESPEALEEEKGTLISSLKNGGILVLNHDDGRVMRFEKKAKNARIITFGFKEGVRLKASNDEIIYHKNKTTGIRAPMGITFKIEYMGNTMPVRLSGGFGKSAIYSALGALAFASVEGINLVTAARALGVMSLPPGRMRLIKGIKNSFLIDDTYNSSPVAAHSALDTLSILERANGGRKIAVLGDMLELGKYSSRAHKELGEYAARVCDMLIGVGLRAENIIKGARDAGMNQASVMNVKTSEEAGKILFEILNRGDIVLIKGSQSIRMEKAVKMIMENSEKAEKLLVRQEPVWETK